MNASDIKGVISDIHNICKLNYRWDLNLYQIKLHSKFQW